jgi:hypothetical protein
MQPSHLKKLAQSRVRAHQFIRAGSPDEEKGEAQDCSGLAGVRGHLDSCLVGALCQNGTVNSAIIGLGNIGNSSRVILTAIVTLPDKNYQFLGQMRLRWWNIPET